MTKETFEHLTPYKSVVKYVKTGHTYLYCGKHLYKNDKGEWQEIVTYYGMEKKGEYMFFSRNIDDFIENFVRDDSWLMSDVRSLRNSQALLLLFKIFLKKTHDDIHINESFV